MKQKQQLLVFSLAMETVVKPIIKNSRIFLEGPLEVEDIRKNKYRLHFYSEIIHRKGDGTETAAFTFMKQHFPQISEEPNFDSRSSCYTCFIDQSSGY